jgi:hypothetical protein
VRQRHDPDGSGDLGAGALVAFAAEFRAAFPDFRDTADLRLAEGGLVATRFTSTGTSTAAGSWAWPPPGGGCAGPGR